MQSAKNELAFLWDEGRGTAGDIETVAIITTATWFLWNKEIIVNPTDWK